MKDGKIQLEAGAVNQPRTLFKPGSWFAKIDFINHLILFNNVLITVLSEKNGGKTSFNTLLQNNLDQQIKSISMTVKAGCDRQSIINDIAIQLHLNIDAETSIASIVAQVNESKAHVLLVIDDAQHVPESLIKEAMIAIKSQNDFGFFHVCLLSDYSVVATLNKLATAQFDNLIHTIDLGSLNESETRTYVLQRAMNARLINRPLTDIQFKQFYQLTKGNLAKINSSLESFINECSIPKKNSRKAFVKSASIGFLAIVIASLSYLYLDNAKFPAITKLTTLPPIEKIIGEPPVQLVSHIASWLDSSTIQFMHYALPKKQILDEFGDEDQNINTVALVDKVVVIPTVKTKTKLAELQSQTTMQKATQVQTPVQEQIQATVHAQAPAVVQAQAPAPVQAQVSAPVQAQVSAPVQAQVSAPVQAQDSAPVQAQDSAPVQAQAQAQAPVQAQDSAPVQAQVPVQAQAPAPVQAPVQAQAPAPAQASAPIQAQASAPAQASMIQEAIKEPKLVKPKSTNQEKLVKKPVIKKIIPNRYTIQLVASHKASDVHRFRKSNKLYAKTQVRHFTSASGSWYVLTMGEYENRTTAQLQAKKLPAELAKLNPWVRAVAGLSNVG